MQAEQHVRENRIIENLLKILDLADERAHAFPLIGQALAGIDLHESAEERPFRQIVLRRIVGRNFLQLWMHAGAVIAL